MKKKIILFLAFVLSLLTFGFVVEANPQTVDIYVTSIFDNDDTVTTELKGRGHGNKVQVLPITRDEYIFDFWIVNGVVREDFPQGKEFTVTSNMNLQAVFHKEGNVSVIFIDSNGKLIDKQFITPGTNATDPRGKVGVKIPTKPKSEVDSTNPWRTMEGVSSLEGIAESTVFVLQYKLTDENLYTITYDDGLTIKEIEENLNKVVEVVAQSSKGSENFSHWVDSNGQILSTKQIYKFTVVGNTTVNAVFKNEAEKETGPVISMTTSKSIRDNYKSYVAQFELSENSEFIESGFVFSRSSMELTKETLGVTVAYSSNYNTSTNEFLMSFPQENHNSIRAFVTYSDSEGIHTIYSGYNEMKSKTYATDLFFSYYIEGSSNNKAIAIFNGTENDVNLNGYSVKLYSNGSTTVGSTLDLNGILLKGEVYVIANSLASDDVKNLANIFHGVANFNGDDVVTLNKNELLIDSIGTVGNRDNSYADKSLIRKSSVISPNSTYDANEWETETIDYQIGLNKHLLKNNIHEVVYNIDGNKTVEELIEGSKISSQIPIKEGYTFEGWYKDETFSIKVESNYIINQSINLFANWILKDYVITFETNGGNQIEPLVANHGSDITEPTIPSKNGYTFDNWYSDPECTVPFVFSKMPNEDLTLYAKWLPNQYTITFNSNGGNEVTSITEDVDSNITLPTPTNGDMIFGGWFTNIELTNQFVLSTMPAENITLYAKWLNEVIEYQVYFNSNGGSAVQKQTIKLGALATRPTDPAKIGHSFIAWYSDEELNTEFDFTSNTISTDIILYAKWQINKYTVLFNTNGGINVSPQEVEYGKLAIEPTTEKEGSTFAGWFSNPELTIQYNFSTQVTEDLTIYAKWDEETVQKVTFIETFEKFNLSGSSYNSGSYTGVNSVLWTYEKARGDQKLNEKAITFNENGLLKATISGGMCELSFQFVRAFTGTKARTIQVLVNGILIDTISVSTTSDTAQVYNKVFDIKGEFQLTIKTSGAQIKIDDLSWTTNP